VRACVRVCVCVCVCAARHVILPSGSLQILRVRRRDEAVYQCVAVNPLTQQRRDSPVTVRLRIVNGQLLCQSFMTLHHHRGRRDDMTNL